MPKHNVHEQDKEIDHLVRVCASFNTDIPTYFDLAARSNLITFLRKLYEF